MLDSSLHDLLVNMIDTYKSENNTVRIQLGVLCFLLMALSDHVN